jgi:DNA-binding transcriptional ArsR family regulator
MRLDDTLAALADPSRRGTIDRLRQRPERAGDLARALGLSPPAMSRHLRVLRRAGLIEEVGLEEDARARVYRLKPGPFRALRSWAEEVEGFWTEQLEGFRAHVEKRR